MDTNKKQIWINGQFITVSDEVYAAYVKGDRKSRYFEKDLKTERIIVRMDGSIEKIIPSREDSLDRLMDDHAKQFSDCAEPLEDAVIRNMSCERLHTALSQLTEKERSLITALFFLGKTEREYAEQLDIYHNAVHKQKTRILKKLKKLLE